MNLFKTNQTYGDGLMNNFQIFRDQAEMPFFNDTTKKMMRICFFADMWYVQMTIPSSWVSQLFGNIDL